MVVVRMEGLLPVTDKKNDATVRDVVKMENAKNIDKGEIRTRAVSHCGLRCLIFKDLNTAP